MLGLLYNFCMMNTQKSLFSYLFPRLRDLVFIIIFYIVLLIGSMLFSDGDPGRHITAGTYMLENRTIITHDIFSYTMLGDALTPHEWLAQIVFAMAYLAMGMNGVVLLTAIVLSSTFTILYNTLLRQKPAPIFALVFTLLAALATGLHWLARPHIFTLLFFTLWTVLLRRIVKGEKTPIALFPLIMLFWANTHGAFISGFIAWAAYLGGWFLQNWFSPEKRSRHELVQLLIIGVSSLIVTLLNPVGFKLWQTSVGYISNRYLVDLTIEYASTNFHDAISWPALVFFAVTLFALSRGWKKGTWSDGLILAGWGLLGLYSVRNLPLFVIAATPIVGSFFQTGLSDLSVLVRLEKKFHDLEFSLHGFLWPVLVIGITGMLLASGVHLDWQREGYKFRENIFPVRAVDWLDEHPQSGNMFNEFGWGGYLIYRQWPEKKVFMDGQLDFYGETLTRRHQQLIKADPGWEQVVEAYGIDWMLVPVDEPIARVLVVHPDWITLYEDDVAVIFSKR